MTTDTNGAQSSASPGPRADAPRAWARLNLLTLLAALATSSLLLFAAYAKLFYANPNHEIRDYAVGALQIAIVAALLPLHRKWWTWGALAVMWSGMAGWSFYASANGAACGCFAKLWVPPDYTTGVLDSALALISLGIAMLRLAPPALLIASVFGVAVAGPVGWVVAEQVVPPSIEKQIEDARKNRVTQGVPTTAQPEPATPDQAEAAADQPSGSETQDDPERDLGDWKPARERLLATDLLAEVREAEDGVAHLVFVHDPNCHICEALMPFFDEMDAIWEETMDPIMQAHKFSIPEIAEQTDIKSYAWPSTPTVFIVVDGEIRAQWYGETLEGWTSIELQQAYDAFANYDMSLLPAEPQWEEDEIDQ